MFGCFLQNSILETILFFGVFETPLQPKVLKVLARFLPISTQIMVCDVASKQFVVRRNIMVAVELDKTMVFVSRHLQTMVF